jgi:hypothetical protein
MKHEVEPPTGSFEAAELYQLRMALKSRLRAGIDRRNRKNVDHRFITNS